MYSKGIGANESIRKAFHWISKAAKDGNVSAQLELALWYFHGNEIAMNENEALKWFTKAAKQKSPPALYNLGNIYESRNNYSKALKYYQEASDLGDIVAQMRMASIYANGKHVKKDLKKAEELYIKIATNESPFCILLAADFYVSINKMEEALKYVNKTLKKEPNSAQALETLGRIQYKQGQYKEARRTLEKSIKICPKDFTSIILLTDTYIKLEEKEKAILLLKKTIKATKDDDFKELLKKELEDIEKGIHHNRSFSRRISVE
jgi:tetratricopeptide (TPR) repeat protein